jgi:2-amino-4-hydroxy-6-hydroxymethyldihydropteridine diphosphokinase/dihydropteroate synthase
MEGKLLSVGTFYSQVAAQAVKRGANMINDVSGGQLDPNFLKLLLNLEFHMLPCT